MFKGYKMQKFHFIDGKKALCIEIYTELEMLTEGKVGMLHVVDLKTKESVDQELDCYSYGEDWCVLDFPPADNCNYNVRDYGESWQFSGIQVQEGWGTFFE